MRFIPTRTDGRHLIEQVAGIPRRLVDLIYPPVCAACQRPVADDGALCGACWARVDWIERPVCEHLGTPFSHDIGPGALSALAIAEPQPFARARSAAIYGDVVRKLVHDVKYRDRQEVAKILAAAMIRAGQELIGDADLVVPVPLHPWRQWTRRYNQSALLARAICRASGPQFAPDLVRRKRRTTQQVGLSATDRRKNVAGAFVIAPGMRVKIRGKRVLLVDDVITSGATVTACTRALKRGGAADVDVLSFARVVGGEEFDL